ncbi:hypothetical protein [Mycoplasma sp. Mirounga ES2805-ORL]|uniref:hypothetical protein n=1 Tax=Mycoplasma sp. Mirounga ES2805-ORL TaxID=754514 RepID=UPI00197CAC99|nr:hypothetical protein [Mycoplasma sp. Mirounga ES2805-ORL]QSF13806.1 hypothetical protein JXZ90_00685 [Mycoplasma sp. Mirounga ES2805-ORL]
MKSSIKKAWIGVGCLGAAAVATGVTAIVLRTIDKKAYDKQKKDIENSLLSFETKLKKLGNVVQNRESTINSLGFNDTGIGEIENKFKKIYFTDIEDEYNKLRSINIDAIKKELESYRFGRNISNKFYDSKVRKDIEAIIDFTNKYKIVEDNAQEVIHNFLKSEVEEKLGWVDSLIIESGKAGEITIRDALSNNFAKEIGFNYEFVQKDIVSKYNQIKTKVKGSIEWDNTKIASEFKLVVDEIIDLNGGTGSAGLVKDGVLTGIMNKAKRKVQEISNDIPAKINVNAIVRNKILNMTSLKSKVDALNEKIKEFLTVANITGNSTSDQKEDSIIKIANLYNQLNSFKNDMNLSFTQLSNKLKDIENYLNKNNLKQASEAGDLLKYTDSKISNVTFKDKTDKELNQFSKAFVKEFNIGNAFGTYLTCIENVEKNWDEFSKEFDKNIKSNLSIFKNKKVDNYLNTIQGKEVKFDEFGDVSEVKSLLTSGNLAVESNKAFKDTDLYDGSYNAQFSKLVTNWNQIVENSKKYTNLYNKYNKFYFHDFNDYFKGLIEDKTNDKGVADLVKFSESKNFKPSDYLQLKNTFTRLLKQHFMYDNIEDIESLETDFDKAKGKTFAEKWINIISSYSSINKDANAIVDLEHEINNEKMGSVDIMFRNDINTYNFVPHIKEFINKIRESELAKFTDIFVLNDLSRAWTDDFKPEDPDYTATAKTASVKMKNAADFIGRKAQGKTEEGKFDKEKRPNENTLLYYLSAYNKFDYSTFVRGRRNMFKPNEWVINPALQDKKSFINDDLSYWTGLDKYNKYNWLPTTVWESEYFLNVQKELKSNPSLTLEDAYNKLAPEFYDEPEDSKTYNFKNLAEYYGKETFYGSEIKTDIQQLQNIFVEQENILKGALKAFENETESAEILKQVESMYSWLLAFARDIQYTKFRARYETQYYNLIYAGLKETPGSEKVTYYLRKSPVRYSSYNDNYIGDRITQLKGYKIPRTIGVSEDYAALFNKSSYKPMSDNTRMITSFYYQWKNKKVPPTYLNQKTDGYRYILFRNSVSFKNTLNNDSITDFGYFKSRVLYLTDIVNWYSSPKTNRTFKGEATIADTGKFTPYEFDLDKTDLPEPYADKNPEEAQYLNIIGY